MNVWVTGSARGQLYHELKRSCPDDVEMIEQPEGRLDITDRETVLQFVEAEQPDVIINAAAYTAVDTAESEPDKAAAVNVDAVANLVDAARAVGAHLIQVSTDFVFGASNGSPFVEDAPVAPVSVYGKTKLAGERLVREQLPEHSLVVRTAWVYSAHGNNFVKTMIRLMNERDEVGVIADQTGSPTWANALAHALWRAAEKKTTGTLHWTGAGVASWYDFAVAISEEGQAMGLIGKDTPIKPLRTDQYPTPAARPNYSVLELTNTWEQLDLQAAHWRTDLRAMLEELR